MAIPGFSWLQPSLSGAIDATKLDTAVAALDSVKHGAHRQDSGATSSMLQTAPGGPAVWKCWSRHRGKRCSLILHREMDLSRKTLQGTMITQELLLKPKQLGTCCIASVTPLADS